MREIRDMLRGKRAALFDLDGTLIDSIGVWNETDRLLALELAGAAPAEAEILRFRDESLRRFGGEPDSYLRYAGLLKQRYASPLSAEAIYARRNAISRQLLAEQVGYKPGADAFLRALKGAGFALALTTSGRRSSLAVYRTANRRILDRLPLDEAFDLILTREDVERMKPDPEIYRLAVARLDLPAAACLVFEDALTGVQAAKAAGLEVCAVYDRHADPDRAAIDGLADWQAADWPALLDALDLG